MYPYPNWWAGATTVTLRVVGGAYATFAKEDVELTPWYVAFPANEGASWAAGIVPWYQVVNLSQAS